MWRGRGTLARMTSMLGWFKEEMVEGIAGRALVRLVQRVFRRVTKQPIFYPNREVLDRESPLADKMQGAETIYAMWLTGIKALVEVKAIDRIDRLLLPDPDSASLKFLQSTLENEPNLGREIRRASKIARKKGRKVRWLREFIGYSLMIGNPKSENAWLHIEMVLPELHGSDHPSFEFKKPKHSSTVDDVIKMFNSLWESDEKSREPEDSELENG